MWTCGSVKLQLLEIHSLFVILFSEIRVWLTRGNDTHKWSKSVKYLMVLSVIDDDMIHLQE